MRLVVETSPGVVEMNWMWLPTWIGHNTELKKKAEKHIQGWLAEQDQPVTTSEENLDRLHDVLLAFILGQFPEVRGLQGVLEATTRVDFSEG